LSQGVALSAKLFHIALEKVIRTIETNPNGTIFKRTRRLMAYADVVLICGRSVSAIAEVVTQIKELQ
jgi:tRNA G37 N-methylase TrmD